VRIDYSEDLTLSVEELRLFLNDADSRVRMRVVGHNHADTEILEQLRHDIRASSTTTETLARIGALYAIDDEVRGKPADLRLSVRQTRARPLLEEMRKWMEKALRSLSAKSETAAAIRYALSRWSALTRYTEDGLLEIDNSAAERVRRAVALCRKNYLVDPEKSGNDM
jgi:hypothetical protein